MFGFSKPEALNHRNGNLSDIPAVLGKSVGLSQANNGDHSEMCKVVGLGFRDRRYSHNAVLYTSPRKLELRTEC